MKRASMHMFRVLEDDYATYHVVAATESHAIEMVQIDSEGLEYESVQMPDESPFTMHLVDSPCDPEDPDVAEWIGAKGFTVDLNGDHPKITGSCAAWAGTCSFPQVLTCSEW
jgi:hypothetical protein